MNLDFTSDVFKGRAIQSTSANYENNITAEDAFFIVLRGLDYSTIDNLCEVVKNRLKFSDSYKIYEFIQNNGCNNQFRKIVLESAYKLVFENIYLGNKIDDDKYNASGWISHVLLTGEVCASLARKMGLNEDCARKLGILHDIGRKYTHKLNHTTRGYEYLLMLGLKDEAIACLTHSFQPIVNGDYLKGNRCANCDPALPGFYIDERGNGVFSDESNKDDIAYFLDNYNYNMYDCILNIADLMATSNKIVSPYERLEDVYKRRVVDKKNSSFFKVCFINSLRRLLYNITGDLMYYKIYNINEMSSVDMIDNLLRNVSDEFFNMYNNYENKNTMKI